jgi:response regulator RpfG family c-di-GMP phosphodiesterase
MKAKVLFVDDDDRILGAALRNFRNRYELDTASGGAQALRALEDHGPYAVVVADMAMPGMNGIEFMRQARELAPETVRILFTGHVGPATLLEAINGGEVFRFIPKPSDPEALGRAVDEGVAQHRMVIAERELLGATLKGSLAAFSGLFETLDPQIFFRARHLEERAGRLARDLKAPRAWTLTLAAQFTPLWLLPLAPATRARTLSECLELPADAEALTSAVARAALLVQGIPRLEEVAETIRLLARGYDGSGIPSEGPSGEDLPLGSRILRVLLDFNVLAARVRSEAVALESLHLAPGPYDPKVLQALSARIPPAS